MNNDSKIDSWTVRFLLALVPFLAVPSLSHGAEDKVGNPAIGEKILAYQKANGGWPKNYDFDNPGGEEEFEKARSERDKIDDATIDNGATFQEIRYLATLYRSTKDERYSDAANLGFQYLLGAQYENGGWPQYYPNLKGYFRHITFNDGAMIGVMTLLRDLVTRPGDYPFVTDDVREKGQLAIEKGLACILKCQVRIDGQPTVWCAQHDEVTFAPTNARTYELASLSGSESVGITRYLIGLENPDEEVIAAIEGAVAWFEKSKLDGIRIEEFMNPEGKEDIRIVEDNTAPPLWARFYDMKTGEPFYCSRDGIPRKSPGEISHERRTGYSWLGEYGRDLLKKDYPRWKAKRE